jgi:hypothetical protein
VYTGSAVSLLNEVAATDDAAGDTSQVSFAASGGIVNFADFALFRTMFGKSPGPSGPPP